MEELQEDPLGPLHVALVRGAELSRPVVAEPQRLELPLEPVAVARSLCVCDDVEDDEEQIYCVDNTP